MAAHVWTCKDPRQDVTWEKSIERLRTWMNDYPTHPAVTKAIIDNLSAWRKGSPTQPTTSTFLGLDLAIAAQSRVGWQLLLEGRQVLEWEAVQQRYFEFEESRKTGRRWAVALIKKLWEVAWDLWEYRNSIVHHKEMGQLELDLRNKIQWQFARGTAHLPKQVARLFSPGIDAILKSSLDSRQAWLIRVTHARARARRRRAAAGLDTLHRERALLRRWLSTANPGRV